VSFYFVIDDFIVAACMSVFFMHVCCVISIKYDDDIDDDEDWP